MSASASFAAAAAPSSDPASLLWTAATDPRRFQQLLVLDVPRGGAGGASATDPDAVALMGLLGLPAVPDLDTAYKTLSHAQAALQHGSLTTQWTLVDRPLQGPLVGKLLLVAVTFGQNPPFDGYNWAANWSRQWRFVREQHPAALVPTVCVCVVLILNQQN